MRVVNRARVKDFAQSQFAHRENDRIDAQRLALPAVLAELGSRVGSNQVPAARTAGGRVKRLQALSDMCPQAPDRLEAVAYSGRISTTT